MQTRNEGGVMDIQKEREAFEATSPFSIYTDKVERDGERYKPVHYKDLDYAQIMSFRWLAWQAAKAQKVAVPDTHILMPKEPTSKHAEAFWNNFIVEQPNAQTMYFAYKAMIEAQEPTHD